VECVEKVIGANTVTSAEEPDHGHRLLRAHGKRPRRCRATKKRDELAPSHVRSQAQVTAS
jgi:hypothetical protein